MSTIMCTKDLWRRMDGSGDLPDRPLPRAEATKMGAWAAKAVPLPGRACCVALNEITYLMVAFPLPHVSLFKVVFAYALWEELEHIGVPASVIEAELASFREGATFAKNSNGSLLELLDDVSFHFAHRITREGGIKPSALATVQHRLNRMRHTCSDTSLPYKAALLLLSDEVRV